MPLTPIKKMTSDEIMSAWESHLKGNPGAVLIVANDLTSRIMAGRMDLANECLAQAIANATHCGIVAARKLVSER